MNMSSTLCLCNAKGAVDGSHPNHPPPLGRAHRNPYDLSGLLSFGANCRGEPVPPMALSGRVEWPPSYLLTCLDAHELSSQWEVNLRCSLL
jgi:hypothetical protein